MGRHGISCWACGSSTGRAGELQKRLADFGAFAIETGSDIWRDIRDVALFHDWPGDVWRLSVKPTDAPGLVDRVEGSEAVYDRSGRLVWPLVPAGTGAARIRLAVAETGGTRR